AAVAAHRRGDADPADRPTRRREEPPRRGVDGVRQPEAPVVLPAGHAAVHEVPPRGAHEVPPVAARRSRRLVPLDGRGGVVHALGVVVAGEADLRRVGPDVGHDGLEVRPDRVG
ncbi:hypothetical protein THAOC_15757, partial [Thalassiosira oceanica]